MVLFEYDFQTALKLFEDYISYKNMETFTLILSSTEKEFGIFPKSDIILVYSPVGELVIFAERLFYSDYTEKEVRRYKLSTQILRFKRTKEISCNVICKDNYLDVVRYKRWWYKWAKKLL